MVLFAFKAFLAGVLLAVIESTLANALEIAGIRPDIAVLCVVVATSRIRFRKTMTLAFTLGLARDFFCGGVIGMSACSLTLTAYVLLVIEDSLVTSNRSAQVFITFLGSVISGTLFLLLKVILQYGIGSAGHIFDMLFWTALYTALLAPAAFALTKKPQFPSYLRLKMKYKVRHETLPEAEV
jgi:rod shape-determining protein MreD